MDVTYHGEEAYATRRGRDPGHPRGRGRGAAAGGRPGLEIRGSIQGVDAKELRIETDAGPARAYLHRASEPLGALVLGHGAAGGVGAPRPDGGHRGGARRPTSRSPWSSSPTAWPASARARRRSGSTRPGSRWSTSCAAASCAVCRSITGGRSAGARVACRTAGRPAPLGSSASPSRCSRRPASRAPSRRAASTSSRRSRSRCSSSRARATASGSRPRRGVTVVLVAGDTACARTARRSPRPCAGGCRVWSPPPRGDEFRPPLASNVRETQPKETPCSRTPLPTAALRSTTSSARASSTARRSGSRPRCSTPTTGCCSWSSPATGRRWSTQAGLHAGHLHDPQLPGRGRRGGRRPAHRARDRVRALRRLRAGREGHLSRRRPDDRLVQGPGGQHPLRARAGVVATSHRDERRVGLPLTRERPTVWAVAVTPGRSLGILAESLL